MNTQEMMNALRRDPSLCDTLIDSLDTIASGRNAYEYGLPRQGPYAQVTQDMWHAVMRWVEDTASELTKDSEYARGRADGIAAGLEEAAKEFDRRDARNPGAGFYDPHEPAEIIRALKGS